MFGKNLNIFSTLDFFPYSISTVICKTNIDSRV